MRGYQHQGNRIVFVSLNGETEDRATTCSEQDAAIAVRLLNRAIVLNDEKRQYTAAARLIAEVEAMPCFQWIEAAEQDSDGCPECARSFGPHYSGACEH